MTHTRLFLLFSFLLLVCIAGVLGLLAAILPWWAPVACGLAIIVAPLIWFWPSIGLIMLLTLILGIVPAPQKLTDAATIAFFLFVLLRRWKDIGCMLVSNRTQLLSITAIGIVVTLSAINGYYYFGNFSAYVYNETTVFLYWILFPTVALLSVRESTTKEIFLALIGFAVLLAVAAVFQSVFGIKLINASGARLEELDAASGGSAGLSRSIVPGTLILLFALFTALAMVLRRNGHTLIWFFILMVVGAGLFVNFGRGMWAAAFVGCCITASLMGTRYAIRFLLGFTIFGLVLVTNIALMKPEILDATLDRVTSVQREGGMNTSFGWRVSENQFAWPKIKANLWTGIGLGGEYKPPLVPIATFSEQTRYIHNAYMYLLLKMGVIGLFAVLANHLFLLKSVISKNNLRQPGSALNLSMTSILVVVPLLSVTQPELFSMTAVAILAILSPIALNFNSASDPHTNV